MKNETLACIKKQDIKYLQAGQISKFIFPVGRKEAHKDHVPHLIVRVFIISIDQKENIHYLIQKRGKNKREFPGYFTDSASGHVLYEEHLDLKGIKENAFRELEEEFGIKRNELKALKFHKINAEENHETLEVAYIFIGLSKNNIELNPDPEEVDVKGSKFYSESELKNILNNKKNVDYSREMWEKLLDMDYEGLFEEKTESISSNKEDGDIALFIGRFQPLHHGHIYVINRILENHKKVKIGIGSSQLHHEKNNPFTSEERKQFFKAAFKKRDVPNKKYKLYNIPDIFNSERWVEHVSSIVGYFQIVYSNSDWVRGLFKEEGYELAKKHLIFKNKFEGNHIRELIAKGKKEYRNLVPNEVIQLMKKFDGLERIKKLHQEGDQNE
ncbi:MAG: Nicotinamide-nucleotide adenylyltransferase [Promethearchaeota archaeon]|nr:MAG: Nicotinamide-nucleotide adenylyltransferase [Candidatus Lokiarchaeota archaeon]